VTEPRPTPQPTNPPTGGHTGEGVLVRRRALELITGFATLGFGALIMRGALAHDNGWGDRGPEPGYFPFWVGIIIVVGSLGVIVQSLLMKDGARDVSISMGQARRAAAFFLPVIAFVATTLLLGFYVAMALYLMFVMTLQGGYRVLPAVLISIGTAVAFYGLFDVWLQVPLLKGPLEARLGIH
jgi:Tripartite tricarboxylate transporter TctB family